MSTLLSNDTNTALFWSNDCTLDEPAISGLMERMVLKDISAGLIRLLN